MYFELNRFMELASILFPSRRSASFHPTFQTDFGCRFLLGTAQPVQSWYPVVAWWLRCLGSGRFRRRLGLLAPVPVAGAAPRCGGTVKPELPWDDAPLGWPVGRPRVLACRNSTGRPVADPLVCLSFSLHLQCCFVCNSNERYWLEFSKICTLEFWLQWLISAV